MKRLFVIFLTLTISFCLVLTPVVSRAQEGMKTIFIDTFYGMAAGALIASALSLAQDNPDWGENVGTGAAIGGIGGALFGIATEMQYITTVENGKIHINTPSIGIETEKVENNKTLEYTAGIFQYKF